MNPMRSSNRDIEDFGSSPSHSKRETSSGPSLWNYVTAVLVVVVLVTIPILFVMVSNIKTDSKSYYLGSASAFSAAAGNSIAGGNAVSLSSTGVLQAGAGTSIYRNIVDIVATCPNYLNMDAINNNVYLIGYSDTESKTTSLQVVTVDDTTPNKGTVVQTKVVDQMIGDMATLSSTTGLFVGICQDTEAALKLNYVVAGTVNPTTYAISALSQVAYNASSYSIAPRITRLSNTEFAIAYYYGELNQPQYMVTQYGQVNPTTMEITLSEPVRFQQNWGNLDSFDVVGLASKAYMLVFNNGTSRINGGYGTGPLMGIYATVTANVVTLSETAMLQTDASPILNLVATAVSDTAAVVAFADYNHNYGINTQLVYVKNGEIAFGSSLLLSNAPSLNVDGAMMDLDIAMTSDDGEFMVLYSDSSNNNAMTATTAQITASQEIERSSPDFLLNSGDAASTTKYSWGALAVGSSTPLAGRTGILSAVTNGVGTGCNTNTVNFAMMDELPGLFGTTAPTTTTTYSAGSTIDVITAGVQSGWSTAGRAPLTTGAVYYTNTMGKVMKSSTFYGHEADSTTGYFYDAASNTIVTAAGRVGYAVSSDALVVEH